MTITYQKLVKSTIDANGICRFSPCDQTAIAIATCRATFWPCKFDVKALEQALGLLVEDLNFLAGRIGPLKTPVKWKMGDLCILNNNAGAEFTVVDAPSGTTLQQVGPDNWTMNKVTISAPEVPFYIPKMDTSMKMLQGKEPLCKVQLTRLADGDILGITLSHTITDGIHWPALMTHLAARYRQAVSGVEADTAELIAADAGKATLTLEKMVETYKGHGKDWTPEPFSVSATLCDYWRALTLLVGNARKKVNFDILYISKDSLQDLKARVQEGHPECSEVTSGDIIQALAAIIIHTAEGKPLVPVKPKCMLALIQIPGVDKSYFGNAVHPMTVGIPAETAAQAFGGSDTITLTATTDYLTALRLLATEIRRCVKDIRNNPTKALQALYETEVVCAHPILKSLAFLAGHKFPYVTCTTNYIGTLPTDATLDFGLGCSQVAAQWLVTPLARDMAIIRPAVPPYGPGLFVHMALTEAQSAGIKGHAVLEELVPKSAFLGASLRVQVKGNKSLGVLGAQVHVSEASSV